MKNKLPEDFEDVYRDYSNRGKISVNILVKHYNSSPSVIKRWLEETNLRIEKNNVKKELTIDLNQFVDDISIPKFTMNELEIKYNISKKNIRNICKRLNVVLNVKNELFEPNDKDKFLDYLMKYGKQKTAKKYKTSLAIIIGYCKRNNIQLESYHGLKRHDLIKNANTICNLYTLGYSLNKIGQIFNTNNRKVKEILIENKIEVETSFDQWKNHKSYILNNFEIYQKENEEGLNLLEISNKHNLSYEQLKDCFKEKQIDVKLHSYNKSKGENEVKDFIKSLGIECNSIKRNFNDITYEIDCYIPEHNFGIEYCGEYWHSYDNLNSKTYHQDKFLWCQSQNITLMTIFEHEWNIKKELVKNMIKTRIGLTENKIYARKTNVVMIPNHDAKRFHDHNHINGGLLNVTINLALIYENNIVSVASFSKSRFDKNIQYELIRFSSLQNHIIVGGFSKLFKEFLKITNAKTVLSYCDLRFGNGNVYEKNGFINKSITVPNYWYYFKKDGKFGKLESRMKYQKHTLEDFSNYHKNKTEYQIMKENGFLRIYDCGNYKYIYEKEGN